MLYFNFELVYIDLNLIIEFETKPLSHIIYESGWKVDNLHPLSVYIYAIYSVESCSGRLYMYIYLLKYMYNSDYNI